MSNFELESVSKFQMRDRVVVPSQCIKSGAADGRTVQIKARAGTWLSKGMHDELRRYADILGLESGVVASLLMQRACRSKRVLKAWAAPPAAGRRRLTASGLVRAAEFRNVMANVGVGSEAALRTLIAVELQERWLMTVLESD